jgi:hypothetical protein
MLHIFETSKLTPVLTGAQNLLDMIQTGQLFSEVERDKEDAVLVSDRLQRAIEAAVRELADASHNASPFLRYRKEILGGYSTAIRLQNLVMNLWNDNFPCQMGRLLCNADAKHKRIAFELIASYARHGEGDEHFMQLAEEILDLQQVAA